jgi:methionyl-tRNA formyltransferase
MTSPQNKNIPIRIIFLGTPKFARPTLCKLIDSDYKPVLVVTQPDRPQGRKLLTLPTPVKEVATTHDIPCFQPQDINSEHSIGVIRSYKPDIMITVAYGGFLSKKLIGICRYSAINLHPSLLPKYRGADPIRSALLAGDDTTGITYFFLTKKMDSGPIIVQKSYAIPQNTNFTELETYLSHIGASDVIEVIDDIKKHEDYFVPSEKYRQQNHEEATYSKKLKNSDNSIDLDVTCETFLRKMRAYTYTPGYFCTFRGKKLKVTKAQMADSVKNTIVGNIKDIRKDAGFVIGLQDGDILITEVHPEGKNLMSAWQYHIGARLQTNETISNGL